MCSGSLLDRRLQIKTQWGVAEARLLIDTREVQQVQLPEDTEHDATHGVMESGVQKSDRTDQNPRLPTFYCLSSSSKKQSVLVCLCVCLHVCVRSRRSDTLKLTAGSFGPIHEQSAPLLSLPAALSLS